MALEEELEPMTQVTLSVWISFWETAYIVSGAPIDRSMIGFGVFGLLVFYFSLYYRPMRLLDRMLSNMVSEQKQPVFFFDETNRCIWMNRIGAQFLDLEEHELDKAGTELRRMFGKLHPGRSEWQDTVIMESNGVPRRIELTKQPFLSPVRR